MIIDAQAIRMVRTEEGKKLRKQYEHHEIEHGFNEHREMELRTDGVSNTLSTVQKDNYICEVKRVGNLSDTKTQSRTVYDSEGLSPTLCSGMDHGNTMPHICEKTIVAMRGRNPENPSDRTVGAPTEQRLEPNSQGICNTITSVQKDNMVMETVRIKQATKDGYIECKVGGVADLSFPSSETRRGRVQEGGEVCPTITATETGVCRIEGYKNYRIRKMTEKEYQKAMDAYYRTKIRIRKLTPKECWRLMDFSDEDFHKAEAVNSNTQLYKQAGNSIVRNCLVAIFGQMLPGKEDDYKKGA
jgi:DNA (cytosine-5)-methyltransferase 1